MTITPSRMKRKYGPRIVRLLRNIKEELEEYGYSVCDPFEMSDEEYEWWIDCEKEGQRFDVRVTIVEEKVREGPDDARGVNFSLSVSENDGAIMGGVCPYNYSDKVWVNRRDPDAVERRWQMFADVCDPSELADHCVEHFV